MSDTELKTITQLEDAGLLKISRPNKNIDLSNTSKYRKIEIGSYEQIQLSGLLAQMPMVSATGSMSNLCIITFPKGISGTLMSLKQGGFSAVMKGPDGRFTGTASLYRLSDYAVIAGAFTAMSIASSQYFLAEINSKLKLINYKMDKILGFLYGDKKAELLSEISYVKRAYDNYHSLMLNDYQRTATVIGLQQSSKIALKDIEFYIQDLHSEINGDGRSAGQLKEMFDSSLQIRDSLNLSLQLYVMCSVLEIYYSQNTDESYISNLEHELITYIEKCNNRMIDDLSALKTKLHAGDKSIKSKIPLGTKFDTDSAEQVLTEIIDSMHDGDTLAIRDVVRNALKTVTQEVNVYIDEDKNFYFKIA